MSFSQQNGKSNHAYEKGYKEFYKMIHSKLIKTPWRHFGVFSFYNAPYLDSEKIYLSDKQVLLAVASEIKTKQNSLIFLLDATDNSEIESQRFIQLFRQVFPKSQLFYFGPRDSERVWLHDYQITKIPLEWLIRRPDMFARALTDSSPLGEILGPADVSFEDISEMKEVLIDKLGPPSLSGEVLGKFRDADVSEYAGDAVGIATAMINPAVAVSRGVRYLGKFVSLVRKRRQKEIKDFHNEWRLKVMSAYSEENIEKLFDTSSSTESNIIDAQSNNNPILILIETRDTLYDVFMPLVINYLIEELGYRIRDRYDDIDSDIETILDDDLDEPSNRDLLSTTESTTHQPEVILFMDFGTHLANFRTSFQYILKSPDKYANISLSSSFYTNHQRVKGILSDAIQKFINSRAIIFDLHPALFDQVTTKTPITTKVWLQDCLHKMKTVQSHNAIAFLEYNSLEEENWQMRTTHKSQRDILARVRKLFKPK
jgi:hypothetical protein